MDTIEPIIAESILSVNKLWEPNYAKRWKRSNARDVWKETKRSWLDLTGTVHHLLQASSPCPPCSWNAIVALQVFSDKTVFGLKTSHIYSCVSAILFSYSSQSLTPFWQTAGFAFLCHVLSRTYCVESRRGTQHFFFHEASWDWTFFSTRDDFFVVFAWWLYILQFLHYFVLWADVYYRNSFTKFAYFINMEKELFILLALISNIYAGKLIHFAFLSIVSLHRHVELTVKIHT